MLSSSEVKVLVTGATGFIGSYVIKELLRSGKQVIATSKNIESARIKDWFSQVTYVAHTIGRENNDENLYLKFKSPTHLIHLAWQGLPHYSANFHFENNLPRQYAFLKQIVTQGLENVTVTGTCFEYGMKDGSLNEEMIPDPSNSYAIAKNSLRLFLEQFKSEKDFILKWVRLFYIHGNGQKSNSLLPQLEAAIVAGAEIFPMTGGEQVRDYLSVEKAAEYIVKIALQNSITGVINCSSNQPIKIKDLVSNYIKDRNKEIKLDLGHYPYPDHEPMEFWGDDKKLQSILQIHESN